MAETLTGYRSILSKSYVYDFFQLILGQKKGLIYFINNFVKPTPGDNILDIGCGTAAILEFLPEVNYVGFDKSSDYINRAKEKYGNRGNFNNSLANNIDLASYSKFDIVILIGVLHHLDDREVKLVFNKAKEFLKVGGRLVTEDPTFTTKQNWIAKLLIGLDRGKNVRTPNGYKALAEDVFLDVKISVRHKKFIPYTHAFLECIKLNQV